jgi:hypothetical protein
MNMTQYLAEVRPAIEVTIAAIWGDIRDLDLLTKEVRHLTDRTHAEYDRVDSVLSIDPNDDEGLATMQYWDTYFGVDKDRFYKNQSLEELQQRVDLKRFSLNVLSGSVLQIGKQGMSIANNGLDASAAGRLVGTQPLKNVIWQGRNQAMHWEEGRLNRAVQDCFATLAADIDGKFANYSNESMAFHVLQLLNWTSFDAFSADMMSLSA